MKFRIFDTALGQMVVGWTGTGLSRLVLPGETPAQMTERMARAGYSEAADGQHDLIARVVAYAEGAADAFVDVPVDLSGVAPQSRRIYEHIRGLAWGQTTSYGAIARWLGDVALSRAVGAAMGANPVPLVIPCHRVLAADGRTGGFSSPDGVRTKMQMLALEHAASPTGQFSFGF